MRHGHWHRRALWATFALGAIALIASGWHPWVGVGVLAFMVIVPGSYHQLAPSNLFLSDFYSDIAGAHWSTPIWLQNFLSLDSSKIFN
jgi:hypothetical protein